MGRPLPRPIGGIPPPDMSPCPDLKKSLNTLNMPNDNVVVYWFPEYMQISMPSLFSESIQFN
jgi:hypothetical protein